MEEGIIKPADFLLPKIKRKVILFYNLNFFYQFREMTGGGKVKSFGPAKRFMITNGKEPITVLGGVIGASFAVMMLENAIDQGVDELISFGTAGWIGGGSPPIGEVVTAVQGIDCTGICRDYGGESVEVEMNAYNSLRKTKLTSINSIYAFTQKKLNYLQKMGVNLMDMEAVPLSYVAQGRGCFFQSIFLVSDYIDQQRQWHNRFQTPKVKYGVNQGLDLLFKGLGIQEKEKTLEIEEA